MKRRLVIIASLVIILLVILYSFIGVYYSNLLPIQITGFNYNLDYGPIKEFQEVKTMLVPGENEINFDVSFQGGGGDNDVAKLTRNGQRLTISLKNIDSASQTMLVLYHISGKIIKLRSGEYVLEVIDSHGRKISEKQFKIQ